MDDKFLKSIVQLTEQTNTTSLGYCVLATLAEMIPLHSAFLHHIVDSEEFLIAKLVTSKNEDGKEILCWEYGHNGILRTDQEVEECSSVIKKISDDRYLCEYLVPITETTSTKLSLDLKESPNEYEMLIDGCMRIYNNYLLLLHENERDKLTGLFNRRTMEERLLMCFNSAMKIEDNQHMPAVALIDIDNFKHVNDDFGHLIGDEVLLSFAQQMKGYFVEGEQLFRFGGEEFVVIFPPQPSEKIVDTLNGFRELLAKFSFPQVGNITFSAGMCSIKKTDYLYNILDHADKALYYAKEHGRNQVGHYEYLVNLGEIVEDDQGDSSVELF
ncbi:GGDEF domain-containing protein [Vibrio sp. T187]|uniref:GGDEF domain-containing protein n=1 Tax=Vibrio TaxID=662 RepID=UPI0010C98628|nr:MULTISPECIES: GGDEF domain-containing protein [Vibrio]MBW3694847.1 GGDEF domain-containing protein [Vibrio sp. T187]